MEKPDAPRRGTGGPDAAVSGTFFIQTATGHPIPAAATSDDCPAEAFGDGRAAGSKHGIPALRRWKVSL